MKRACCILTALVAVLSVACQQEREPTLAEDRPPGDPRGQPGGRGPAVLEGVYDTVYQPGTYVYTEETDDGVVTETLTVPEGGQATLEIDRPGDDDEVSGGIWEQTYDGVRIDFSRRSEGLDEDQRYYKGLEDGDLTEKAGGGKVYVRVPDVEEQG